MELDTFNERNKHFPDIFPVFDIVSAGDTVDFMKKVLLATWALRDR